MASPTEIRRIAVRFAISFVLTTSLAIAVFKCLTLWLGPPSSSGYSTLPTVFYLSSFPMIAAGGTLGWAISQLDKRSSRRDFYFALALGAFFIGWQSYSIWCLPGEKYRELGGGFIAAMILAVAHISCYAIVFALLNLAIAHLPKQGYTKEERFFLQVCAGSWYALGFCWVILLCMFAALM